MEVEKLAALITHLLQIVHIDEIVDIEDNQVRVGDIAKIIWEPVPQYLGERLYNHEIEDNGIFTIRTLRTLYRTEDEEPEILPFVGKCSTISGAAREVVIGILEERVDNALWEMEE